MEEMSRGQELARLCALFKEIHGNKLKSLLFRNLGGYPNFAKNIRRERRIKPNLSISNWHTLTVLFSMDRSRLINLRPSPEFSVEIQHS